MTDEDVYGKVLGKGFDGVRAELCRPESDMDQSADRLADYNLRRFLPSGSPGSRELEDHLRAACAALDGRGGLFAQGDVRKTLEAAATDSLPNQEVARAFASASDAGSDARSFLEKVADSVCDPTVTLAHVQKNYKDDADCHEALDRITPAARARVADDLAQRCGIGGKRIARPVRRGTDDLLDFVVATE